MQLTQMQGVTILAGGLQQPLHLEQLKLAAEVVDLLADLAARGAGAKRATTFWLFS